MWSCAGKIWKKYLLTIGCGFRKRIAVGLKEGKSKPTGKTLGELRIADSVSQVIQKIGTAHGQIIQNPQPLLLVLFEKQDQLMELFCRNVKLITDCLLGISIGKEACQYL